MKKGMRATAHIEQDSLSDIEKLQELQRRRAAEKLTPWGRPEKDDYDFRSWMKGASSELLSAGCLYEYARESRRLRGLLVLMNEFDDEATFETLREEDARRIFRSVALRWLRGYADELADNKSFAALLDTKGKEVRKTITKHPLHLSFGPAIQLALALPFVWEPPPWPWPESWPWDWSRIRERPSYEGGSENIGIAIRWRDFTNSQIVKELKKFVARYRPEGEKEPKPQTPAVRTRAYLKALSVMRIWKLHNGKQWKRLELVAKTCGYKGCVKEAAEYKNRCKQGQAKQPMSPTAKTEISDARSRALKFFQILFPGETPANYLKKLT